MPSVGMRRSTRVFVPKTVVKAADGERVLRSGRRLWSESGKGKPGSASDGDEWFRLLDNSSDAVDDDVRRCKKNGWHSVARPERESVAVMEIDGEMSRESDVAMNNVSGRLPADDVVAGRTCRIVYHRKRRRLAIDSFVSEDGSTEDRMYGIAFFRKQRRKKPTGTPVITESTCGVGIAGKSNKESSCAWEVDSWGLDIVGSQRILAFVLESSCSIRSWRFNCLLHSILSYMVRVPSVRLDGLSAFMSTGPVARVFSLQGIHLLHDLSCITNGWQNRVLSDGVCKIFGVQQLIPLFTVNFAAIPLCFRYMHSTLLVRFLFLPHALVIYLMGLTSEGQRTSESENCPLSRIPAKVDLLASNTRGSGKRTVKNLVAGSPRMGGRSASYRNNANSRISHRRSSLRSARFNHTSMTELDILNRAVGSDVCSSMDDRTFFPSPMYEQKKYVRWSSTTIFREMKSTLVDVRQNADTICCNANILVIESDKCYREEGVRIMLECSSSNEWFLAIKMKGLTKYTHKAQDVLRPCTSNRFTHAMIWTGENGWKLEFSDRRDWLIFKELHRECCDRNMQPATTKVIPVPGVLEVPSYEDSEATPFSRPSEYITMTGDEVSRALMKKTANYDMDSEDEKWIDKINSEFSADNGLSDKLLAESFELIVDALEKANYCNSDDVSDETKAIDLCQSFGKTDIVAAVYNYWLQKRKQKRSALVRIFQFHPPRRAQLLQKPFLRKKRSFKRQASQSGRGKQRSVLKALAAEQNARKNAIAEENAIRAAEEAKRSADKSTELAVIKRQRAQALMEMADLATYKAVMAKKIAEAAEITEESVDAAAEYFLC